MRMNQLRIGMKVHHTVLGAGVVCGITELGCDVDFEMGRRSLSAADQDLHPAEPLVNVSGLDSPLPDMILFSVQAVLKELGIEKQEGAVEGLARRWAGGTLILKPANEEAQAREIPLDNFFHKIVMMRNNLRVLEQKINAHTGLSEAEKVELQQYITRSYGSMTTFNLLFQEKSDQF